MNARHLLNLLQDNYTTIRVSFDGPPLEALVVDSLTSLYEAQKQDAQLRVTAQAKRFGAAYREMKEQAHAQQAGRTPRLYTYKTPNSYGIKVGDAVIVDTPLKGYSIAYVVEVHAEPFYLDEDSSYELKWIVGKVDDSEYLFRQEQERQFLQSIAQAERSAAREKMVKEALDGLPDDSESKKLFQAAVESLRRNTNGLSKLGVKDENAQS